MSRKKVRNNDYLFLSAMIRAREARMPDRAAFERMLDAASFEEAARIASECGYPDMSAMDINGVSAALSAYAAEIFGEIARLAPDTRIVDVFRLKYDCHNAKVVIKSGASGADSERLLSGAGRVSPERIVQAFHDDDYSALPETLGGAMEQARGILARSANPQLADICLDKAYFAELTALAAESGSGFLADYVRLLIDNANLRAAVRTRRMNRDGGFLASVLIDGGTVPTEAISSAEDICVPFAGTALEQCARLGAEAVNGGALTAFELACDNAVTAFLTRAKMTSFGPEPVAAYLAALEQNTASLRMILSAKLSGLSPDIIRERLRETYA